MNFKAAYIGGHPSATRPTEGELLFDGSVLRWTPRNPTNWPRWMRDRVGLEKKEAEPFEINVSQVTSVEFQGDETFKRGPSGYVRLPIVLAGYGGSQPKHPLGSGKLTKALTVRYEDEAGREHEVVWVNTTDDLAITRRMAMKTSDRGGHEIANKIRAAATAARTSSQRGI